MKVCRYLNMLMVFMSVSIVAQEKSGLEILADSSRSGYENLDAMGGPKSVGAQLEVDNQEKAFYFRVPIRVMKPWYDAKAKLYTNTGIQLGINYTAVFLRASAGIDSSSIKSASSGILDIQVGWNLIGRESAKNKGTLFLKINSRHAYGDAVPMFHGIGQSGYYGLPAVGFNDYSIRVLELNWQQNLFNDKLTIILGKVDPTNYFDFHGLIVPWQHFLAYGASVSGTVNWPDPGVGVITGFKFNDKLYAMVGLTDVRGDIYASGDFLYFGDNFFEGNFFKAVEIGYVPSMPERYFKKISVTYWQSDAYTSAGGARIAKGEGLAVSGHWFINETYIPYVRFGFSNGNGENAFYKKDIQIGNGFRFRTHDILGIGLSFAEPNIPGAKDQYTAEVFYRFNLTAHLEVTPDFQFIINPTLNSSEDRLAYFGIRGRVTL